MFVVRVTTVPRGTWLYSHRIFLTARREVCQSRGVFAAIGDRGPGLSLIHPRNAGHGVATGSGPHDRIFAARNECPALNPSRRASIQLPTSHITGFVPLYSPKKQFIGLVDMLWVLRHRSRLQLINSRKQVLMRVIQRATLRLQPLVPGGNSQHFVQHLPGGATCFALKGVRGS